MQSYLFIGGHCDSLSIPVEDGAEFATLPTGVVGQETYRRSMLTVDDTSLIFYRHQSLTPEAVLDRVAESYKAWTTHRPAGRR